MANKANSIVSFLTAKGIKFDTVKSNATARKQDSKDKSENALRFLSMNTKETSGLNDFIENFKTRMFSDVKTIHNTFLAKDILLETFIETTLLETLPCVSKVKTSLQKRFKTEISDVEFLTALKTALTNHENRINKAKTAKFNSLSDKAKAVFSGKEKQNFIVHLTKLAKEEKAKEKAA